MTTRRQIRINSGGIRFPQALVVLLLGIILVSCGRKDGAESEHANRPVAVNIAETDKNTGGEQSHSMVDGDAIMRTEEALAEGFSHAGEKIYAQRCAVCHDQPEQMRAPSLASLKSMSPAQIQFSLKSGKMKMQADGLDRQDIGLLIEYLTPGDGGTGFQVAEAERCTSSDISFDRKFVSRWGQDLANSRYFDASLSKISRDNVASLEVAWVFGLPATSEARSQPVITGDTIFVAATSGHMFALDRFSGCIKWHRALGKPVRAPLTLGEHGGEPMLFFADATTQVYAMRPTDGEILWKRRAGIFEESMSTGGVAQAGDKIIVPLSSMDVAAAMNPKHECCKSHGAIVALDAETGEQLWLTRMMEDAQPTQKSSVGTQLWGPSGAPVWTTPTIDLKNSRIYIGTGENTSAPATDTSDSIIALDLETGEIQWVFQATGGDTFNMACSPLKGNGPNCPENPGPDFDFGGAVTFTSMRNGREVVIGGQKSGDVHAVDAATGEGVWTTKISSGSPLGGTHWGVTVSNGRVYAPSNDPPYPLPDYEAKPGLYVLDIDTGEMIWSREAERGCKAAILTQMINPEPWPECSFHFAYSAAPTSTDDVVFIGALDGRVLAFDTATGESLWEYQTKREFNPVNGVAAHGGSIDNAGIQLADDMLFVQSGYSLFGQMPGNALIAMRLAEEASAEESEQ